MYSNLALSENGFLFDASDGSTYSLNRTGTFLLRGLIGGAPPADLVAGLSEQYGVDPATARRDLDAFLFRLEDLGLVQGGSQAQGAAA